MLKDVAPLPGYAEPYGQLCAILQDATSDWRQELTWSASTREELDAKFGPELVAWRARPNGPSIGAILLHMMVVELVWLEKFVLKRDISDEDKAILKWDEIDVDNDKWPEPPKQPLSWFLDLHDKYRIRTLEAVKSWPPADTVLPGWGEESLTPRWVLGHVIQHESYHGGQINMLYEMWKNRSLPS